MASETKSAAAFRTIGEVVQTTGIAAHVLRYWEARFPRLRPVTRAGNRRYYRPEDIALVERIDRLLNHEGYTIKGVQQLLATDPRVPVATADDPLMTLRHIRALLAQALEDDEGASLTTPPMGA